MKQQITFIPVIDAGSFPNEVESEFDEEEISTHYQSDILSIDWDEDDKDYMPLFKKWLLDTYGDEIKKYERLALEAT